jgi:hypothetical protein
MKCIVVLSEVEEITLQQLSINHPQPSMTEPDARFMAANGRGC